MTSLDLDRAAETFAAGDATSPSASRRSSRSSTRRRSNCCRASSSCATPPRGDPAAARAHHRRADLLGDRDHLRAPARTCTTRSRASASGAGGCSRSPPRSGVALGATGTHPWADYREQPIIDTEHYRRVEEGLKYVAWRNNTFSLHVHLGVRDLDRAVRVCDRLRPVLPLLLAISANSPFLDGRDTRAALGAHAELHQELPALRRARRVRRLAGLPRVHRVPHAHQLDRRVHAGLVVGAAALQLRHGRGAHLRRAGDRRRVRRARLADRRVHRAGRRATSTRACRSTIPRRG